MRKSRLEAFSDGVLAIIITIMVLEIKVPHGDTFAAIRPFLSIGLSYLLSFIYVGIYWNNHHHLLSATQQVNGRVLWANLHLLFWLSLMPFATGWMGQNHFAKEPVAFYGAILFMSGLAYYILERCIVSIHDCDSIIAEAIKEGHKELWSVLLYIIGIALAFIAQPWIACIVYVLIAMLWIIPDQRIEKRLHEKHQQDLHASRHG